MLTLKEFNLLVLLVRNKTWLCTGKLYMKMYGEVIIWEIAELLTFIFKECGKVRVGEKNRISI